MEEKDTTTQTEKGLEIRSLKLCRTLAKLGTGWVVQDNSLLLPSGGEWRSYFRVLFFVFFSPPSFHIKDLFSSADTSLALNTVLRLSHLYAHNHGRLGQSSGMVADEVTSYLSCIMTKRRLLVILLLLQLFDHDCTSATY